MNTPEAEAITSLQNPKIKEVLALSEKPKERKSSHLFAVEGVREVLSCIAGGFYIRSVFFCPQIISEKNLAEIKDALSKNCKVSADAARFASGHSAKESADGMRLKFFEVTPEVYAKIAYRAGTEGVIAVASEKERVLSGIKLPAAPLIIVLENIEKPGNIGALLRTADACGAAAVLVCNPATDLYNPNLIRASLGGVFTQSIVCCENEEACKWLKENNISIYTAQLQNSVPYYDADMTKGCAIVMGSEDEGLTQLWRNASDKKILIPMLGKLDSLNVSVSAAVLCYEAVRQRESCKKKLK